MISVTKIDKIKIELVLTEREAAALSNYLVSTAGIGPVWGDLVSKLVNHIDTCLGVRRG